MTPVPAQLTHKHKPLIIGFFVVDEEAELVDHDEDGAELEEDSDVGEGD
jgi:hypothetical protein